jgi:transposase-like protein
MKEITCPHCQHPDHQQRVGLTTSGSQRYLCAHCQRKYTPHPKPRGYAEALRRQAIQFYVDGMNLRRIARHLGVVHQTVANWVAAYAATLPDAPPLPPVAPEHPLLPVVELDELYTFEGQKNSGSTSSRR